MNRPTQHEIDTTAQRMFQRHLPSTWVVRELRPDYGIDYEIEIFANNVPTGTVFAIQLKGTEHAKYTRNSLSFRFEVDKLIFYFDRVTKPVYLVVIDVKKDKGYWICAQRFVHEVLNKTNPQWRTKPKGKIKVELPLANHIDDHATFENEARNAIQYVFILQFGITNWRIASEVKGILGDSKALEESVKQMELQQNELMFHIAQLHIEGGNLEKAQADLSELLEKTLKYDDLKEHFRIAATLAHSLNSIDRQHNRHAASILDTTLLKAEKCSDESLILLVRGIRAYLEFIFRFYTATDLDLLARAAEPHGSGTDQLLRLFQAEESSSYFQAGQELSDIIVEALQKKYLLVAGQLLVDLADTNLIAYPHIRARSEEKQAAPMLEAAQKGLNFAFQLFVETEQPSAICTVLKSQSLLLFYADNPEYIEAVNEIERLANAYNLEFWKNEAKRLRLQFIQFKENPPFPLEPNKNVLENDLTDEQELELIYHLIKIAGINLQDEDDPISQIINIGLQDRNPERILRYCEHLHWGVDSYGIPAEMVGLPTAGSKILYCDLVKLGIGGMLLDKLLQWMQEEKCNTCKFRNPRPEGWKWSRKWQEEQDRNLPDGLRKMIYRK